MRISDQIQSAQTNLMRTKARTFLTVLAIVIGTFMLAMTTGLTQGIQHYITQQTQAFAQPNSITVLAKHSDNGGKGDFQINNLKPSDLTAVASVPNVTGAYAEYSVQPDSLTVGDKKVTPNSLSTLYPGDAISLAGGSLPDAVDTASMLITYPELSDFGFKTPADALGKQIKLTVKDASGTSKEAELTIRGVLLNSVASQAPYISYVLAEQLATFQSAPVAPSFNTMTAQIKPNLSAGDVAAAKKAIEDKGFAAITYADQISAQQQAIGFITLILDGFAGIALLVATIGIVNTLLMAVLERTQEIGLLKALGMKRRGIFALFAFEAISIGFWGGLIGILLGVAAGPVVNRILAMKQSGNGFSMVYPWEYMVAIVVGAMVVGFLAGVLPAVRASKLDPIEALRRE